MKRKNCKKEYIIISKEDIAYLQNYIIESAVTVATMGVDIALLNLSTKEIQKILKKIRNTEKYKLYLNINKKIPDMNLIMDNSINLPLPFKLYHSSFRVDKTNECIDTILAPSRLLAAKYFSKRKDLSLKNYLKIYKISK